MMENNFITADTKGRNKAIEYIQILTGITNPIIELYQSPDGMDKTDLSMTASTNSQVYTFEIECKDRYNYQSKSFDFKTLKRFKNNDGAIIEIDKFNSLMQKAKEENKVPMYVITYPDNVCLFFNLNRLQNYDIKIDNIKRKKTAIDSTGEMKDNDCYFINKDKAKVAFKNNPKLYTWNEYINMK